MAIFLGHVSCLHFFRWVLEDRREKLFIFKKSQKTHVLASKGSPGYIVLGSHFCAFGIRIQGAVFWVLHVFGLSGISGACKGFAFQVDLSAKGLGEAKSAGTLLKSEGIKVDMAFTSYLKRTLACCFQISSRIAAERVGCLASSY